MAGLVLFGGVFVGCSGGGGSRAVWLLVRGGMVVVRRWKGGRWWLGCGSDGGGVGMKMVNRERVA